MNEPTRRPTARVISIQVVPPREGPDELLALYEKQVKLYPRAVSGWYARWRWTTVWVTQLLFFGLPWVPWSGRQAVLFDLDAGRFYIFGLVLHPQELIYLAALLVIAALVLFFVTAVAGRIWCGYACPQTVYTELFLWLEHHIEGNRATRMRLDAAPWGVQKLARKGAKQGAWMAVSLVASFTFVGYFTPISTLAADFLTLGFSPWEWFWLLFFASAIYGDAGYLREQFCNYMCPYARIQSALTDMDTLVIAYDRERGEARGARSRTIDPKSVALGDCIDCTLCVQVCPVGIDIRNGLQNECIACAACIDVCDEVMTKMDYPKGLIRYASGYGTANQLSTAQMVKRVWRPRVWLYGAMLLVASTALVVSLSTRHGFSVDVIKDRGSMAREVGNGDIENVYRLQIMNATERVQSYTASVSGMKGLTLATPPELTVEAAGIGSLTIRLTLPADAAQNYRGMNSPIQFRVQSVENGKVRTVDEKSTFHVPR